MVKCYCGVEAKRRISRTKRNPDRGWYGCHLPKGHDMNCNFFKWVQEDDGTSHVTSQRSLQDEQERVEASVEAKVEAIIVEMKLLQEATMKNGLAIGELRRVKQQMIEKLLTGLGLGFGVCVVVLCFFLV